MFCAMFNSEQEYPLGDPMGNFVKKCNYHRQNEYLGDFMMFFDKT